MLKFRKPRRSSAFIGGRALAQGALVVERACLQHAVGNQLIDAFELPGLGGGTASGAFGECARRAHLFAARPGDQFSLAPLRLDHCSARLCKARLDRRRIESQQQLALGHGIAFTNRDLDDGLLRLGDQLDPVAFQGAEQCSAIAAAGGNCECRDHNQCLAPIHHG